MKDRRVTQAKNRSSEFVNAKGAKIAVGLRDIVSGSWIVRAEHRDGDVQITTFSGAATEHRAIAYAAIVYGFPVEKADGELRLVVSMQAPLPVNLN